MYPADGHGFDSLHVTDGFSQSYHELSIWSQAAARWSTQSFPHIRHGRVDTDLIIERSGLCYGPSKKPLQFCQLFFSRSCTQTRIENVTLHCYVLDHLSNLSSSIWTHPASVFMEECERQTIYQLRWKNFMSKISARLNSSDGSVAKPKPMKANLSSTQ